MLAVPVTCQLNSPYSSHSWCREPTYSAWWSELALRGAALLHKALLERLHYVKRSVDAALATSWLLRELLLCFDQSANALLLQP